MIDRNLLMLRYPENMREDTLMNKLRRLGYDLRHIPEDLSKNGCCLEDGMRRYFEGYEYEQDC